MWQHRRMARTPSPPAVPQAGLRELKKERTRRHIAETARALFSERGFENVTVAEIAAAAEVAQTTVFNYFPTKEDLVFWRFAAFEEQLLAAVRSRAPGTSVLDAFGAFLLAQQGLLGRADADARAQLTDIARMIDGSPALRAREQQILSGYTDALARLLAEEAGADDDDIRPWVAANAVIGLHRTLIGFTRRRVLRGRALTRLPADVRRQLEQALAVLDGGLGAYTRRG